MSIDGYTRGIPTYKGKDGKTYGHLVETKESCITDDNGVSLTDKLANIVSGGGGASSEELENIINGTTTVGNANKLGGKSASEYVTTADDTSLTGWTELTSGFDLNNALGKYRTASTNVLKTLVNRPESIGSGEITVEWFPSTSSNQYGTQVLKHTYSTSPTMWARTRQSTTWTSWQKIATTSDLENYMPLSGGDINGNLLVGADNASVRAIYLRNSKRNVYQAIDENGIYNLYDAANGKSIIYSTENGTNIFYGTASGNLKLSGGTLENASFGEALYVKRSTTSGSSVIAYANDGGVLGFIGMHGMGYPVYYADNASMSYELFHTGNKPTGTYTGNGSATSRTISLGVQAHAVLIRQGSSPWDSFAIVTGCGSIIKSGTTINGVGGSCSLSGQNISIASSDSAINGTGLNYTWSVLY